VETIWSAIRVRHPTFCAAVAADARITARYRGERRRGKSEQRRITG
jgi:hypothetical protein